MKLLGYKLTTQTLMPVLMLATLTVSILSLFFLYKKSKKGKDKNGKDKKKGEKVYPLPYWSYPYEEFEEFSEDVCDRKYKGKCKQECAKGSTDECLNCLIVCEKQGYRV